MAEGLMPRTLIIGIIVLAVVAISFFGYKAVYFKIYSFFSGDYTDLKESEKSLIQTNFNNFVESAQKCRQLQDEQCLCKNASKNFPNTFPKAISMEISQDINATILLKYNDAIVKEYNKTLEMTGFSSVKKSGSKAEEKSRVGVKSVIISFKDEYPRIKSGDEKIISGDLYKGSFPSTLNFITGGKGDAEFFLGFPLCMDKRKEAILKFNAFISSLSSKNEITVSLPQNYQIFYGEKVIKLTKQEQDVLEYNETLKKSRSAVKFYDFDIKCSEPTRADYLDSGDKINITRTGNTFCIKRV